MAGPLRAALALGLLAAARPAPAQPARPRGSGGRRSRAGTGNRERGGMGAGWDGRCCPPAAPGRRGMPVSLVCACPRVPVCPRVSPCVRVSPCARVLGVPVHRLCPCAKGVPLSPRYIPTTGGRWYKRHLTYRVVNWPPYLPQHEVRLAVRAAFELWSNVSSLLFWEVQDGPADIRLTFFHGDHNDGLNNAFDGPGGALAHAFFPRRGEAHFDSAERWSLRSGKGRNLFIVVAHEVGHTLGLEHSPVKSALMSPYYKKLSKDFVLSWDDILAVQNLYGEPGFPEHPLCGWGGRCGRCWRYAGSTLEAGFPQKCSARGLPRHPDTALFFQQLRRLVLFKGPKYFVVSEETLAVEPYYPRSLRDWQGLPPGTAGALTHRDGFVYFFRDDQFWKFDRAKLQVVATGKWATQLPWMGCWDANSGQVLF
ncbi:matrix metalloproteinase-28 [Manacus vitellinus]|uniref:matrix metalloproteinase-28 n=1 Tax=Manacus vitellinus TaxID=328815 RepID=UPI00115D6C2B|nr:matrix metalloproteinase-28 [Manacus vitellinus]